MYINVVILQKDGNCMLHVCQTSVYSDFCAKGKCVFFSHFFRS